MWSAFQKELDSAMDIVTQKWCAMFDVKVRHDLKLRLSSSLPSFPTIDLSDDKEEVKTPSLATKIAEVQQELEADLKDASIYDDSEIESDPPSPSSPHYSPSEAEDEDDMVYCPPTKTRLDAENLGKRPILLRRAKSN
jgi:hypothetical protein